MQRVETDGVPEEEKRGNRACGMFPVAVQEIKKKRNKEGEENGNKGSSVVEMSLIMPIIFGIVVMVIVLFLDTIRDGLVQQEGYSVIYTYQEGAGLHEQLEEMKKPRRVMQGRLLFRMEIIGMKKKGMYVSQKWMYAVIG